jgi:hypothetical protein
VNGRLKCGQTMCFPYCICCCYCADDQSKWKSDVVMPLESDRIKSIWVQSIRSMLDLLLFFLFFSFLFFPWLNLLIYSKSFGYTTITAVSPRA